MAFGGTRCGGFPIPVAPNRVVGGEMGGESIAPDPTEAGSEREPPGTVHPTICQARREDGVATRLLSGGTPRGKVAIP